MAAKKPARKRQSAAMQSALTRALKSVETGPEDAATVALARRYARMIDSGEGDLWRLGPRLLEVLVELRMTPKARQVVVKGGASDDGGSGEASDPREDALGSLQREHSARSR